MSRRRSKSKKHHEDSTKRHRRLSVKIRRSLTIEALGTVLATIIMEALRWWIR
jgi:hypothetical protein